jgi:hypothetical protein
MHGFTNYEQSKALFEHGYRHPGAIQSYTLTDSTNEDIFPSIPSFSLADLVTMQGAIYHVPAIAPMKEIIQSYVDSCLNEPESIVKDSNQRLNQAHAN